MEIKSYKFPTEIKRIICSDLDETFLPFNDSDKRRSGIIELEEYLIKHIEDKGIIFGWITGSNTEAIFRKTRGYITHFPHFIASSLGTEFYWVLNGKLKEPESWRKRIIESGYTKEKVIHINQKLNDHGIFLQKEPDDYQGKYKSAYYYHITDSADIELRLIQDIASIYGIKTLFSKCNPAAGDPENCYDIEFVPRCCGKGEVIEYLRDELKIDKNNFYAFGDSFNDFAMFEKVGHSFLVKNADPEAQGEHKIVLDEEYCYGIVSKLKEIL